MGSKIDGDDDTGRESRVSGSSIKPPNIGDLLAQRKQKLKGS